MKSGRRLLLQLLMLPFLFALALIDGDLLQAAVAVILLVVWPISIAVAMLLMWLSRSAPDIESLATAADNAVTLAMVQTSLAAVAAIVILRLAGLINFTTGPVVLTLLAYALVLVGLPTVTWIKTMREVWLPTIRRRP